MQRIDFNDQISRNKRNSFFLMLVVFLILVSFGYIISKAFEPGYFFVIMIFSIIFSISYIFLSYYNSDKIAIASVGAKPANPQDYKMFHDLVDGISIASGIPKPKLYVMNSQQINAFASGRDTHHAVICITDGALKKLEKRELESVIAHEMGHIANYDIRYMTLVAVMVGMIAIISEIFLRSLWLKGDKDNKAGAVIILVGVLLAILAPIFVQLVQLAISRKREYTADATAVKFTRYPDALINALRKIKQENIFPEKKVSKSIAPLFFASPLKNLTSTHPPIEKRIQALEKM